MSCLSWNYHRLGNPQTEDELIALVGNKDPKLVFLMEKKVDKVVLERVGGKIQKSNIFVVLRHSIGGGLALFWPTDMSVDIQSYLDEHIDAIIDHEVDDVGRFTSFYGDLDTAS